VIFLQTPGGYCELSTGNSWFSRGIASSAKVPSLG